MTWNLHECVAFARGFLYLKLSWYIYTYNFRTNDMKFVCIGCISDHFCFLEIWRYIYIYIIFCSEQMTWQLHKFGCISDHFCVLQNTDICIYVSEQITWNLYELVACQIMFVSYKKWYIYIYIFHFRTTDNMPFLFIWVPPICLVSRFRGSITHAFPQMGVVLISKAN